MRTPASVTMVVPTIGRPSLRALLESLDRATGPLPERVVLVDDRRDRSTTLLSGGVPRRLAARTIVVPGQARGPAAARNSGWRVAATGWVAFLDDDVIVEPDWLERLQDDLAGAGDDVGASQGRIRVPLPRDRPPTDWERNVRGLETATWATADMAYRREVLQAVGGFDERFGRAYREDADLGLRVRAAGWRIVRGRRAITHPVRAADRWVSVRAQAGNADDALMRMLHGRHWRRRAGVPTGRRGRHLTITAAALGATAALVRGRSRLAAAMGLIWLCGTAEFAWARIEPGPRTPPEILTMLTTSVAVPPAAAAHWLHGWLRLLRLPRRGRARPAAVLFDRDGTLVVDVPYNGDPRKVRPVPGARAALDRLRAAGVPTAVISNQSGVARGLLTLEQVSAVNRRVEELLGPLGPWLVCPHGPGDACDCRKPASGLVRRAAAVLGVRVDHCAVVGDIGSDMDAAAAAGARGVLVPTGATRPEEIAAAPAVAEDLGAAIELLLKDGRR